MKTGSARKVGRSAHLALGGLIWLAGSGAIHASRRNSRYLVVYGTASDVTPTSVTVLDSNSQQVTITTQEDFSQKVAPGSKVTAWYYRNGDGYTLHWLSYSLENDFVAPARIVAEVKSVALLPDAKLEGADALVDQIADFMKGNLGWRVAPKMWAAYLRRRMQKKTSTLNSFDPKTGKFDMNRYVHGEDDLIPVLARRARVNAVLEIQVEKVEAPVSHQVAVWDGMQDQLSGKTMRTISKFDLASLREGHVPAATVILKLWSPRQQLMWSNRRGFAALERYEGLREKLVSWPLENSLMNSDDVNRWLKIAFASLLQYATPPKHVD
jgi:hypothetical protein